MSGTASRIKDAKYPVAGKTGTSRQLWYVSDNDGGGNAAYTDSQGRHVTVGTFAGFFPAVTPKYSVICVLESRPCRNIIYGGTYPVQAVKTLIDSMEL